MDGGLGWLRGGGVEGRLMEERRAKERLVGRERTVYIRLEGAGKHGTERMGQNATAEA